MNVIGNETLETCKKVDQILLLISYPAESFELNA